MNDGINRISTIQRGINNFLESHHTGENVTDSMALRNLSEVLGWAPILHQMDNISISEALLLRVADFRSAFEAIYEKGAEQEITKEDFTKGTIVAQAVLRELTN